MASRLVSLGYLGAALFGLAFVFGYGRVLLPLAGLGALVHAALAYRTTRHALHRHQRWLAGWYARVLIGAALLWLAGHWIMPAATRLGDTVLNTLLVAPRPLATLGVAITDPAVAGQLISAGLLLMAWAVFVFVAAWRLLVAGLAWAEQRVD